MIYIGIDPGKKGGIAILDRLGEVIGVWDMPDTEQDILEVFQEFAGKARAALEKVSAMPGQGVTSMFTFGRGYGALRMALTASRVPFRDVGPKAWQKELGLTGPYPSPKDRKNAHKATAQALFPGEKVTLLTADALLIAEWLRRAEKGA